MKMLGEKFLYLTIKHDALNEKSFVSCGDVISGQIVFEISKEIIVKSIALVANGKTTISWHRGTGDNRSNVFAHENYFNIRTEHVKQHDGDDECEIVLPPGKHVYPFSIQLPQGDFPSSFHGSDCTVCYSLQVTITGPEFMFKQYRSEMNFVNHIDANQPQLLVPLEASNSKDLCCLCCASGPTSMKIRLESCKLAGERIKIVAEFENASSCTLVPNTLVPIQKETCTAGGSKKHFSVAVARIEGKPVEPHSSGVWGDQMLQIPDHMSLSISNCRLVKVEYFLLVRLCIPRGLNLKVAFPLVMCSIPVSPDLHK